MPYRADQVRSAAAEDSIAVERSRLSAAKSATSTTAKRRGSAASVAAAPRKAAVVVDRSFAETAIGSGETRNPIRQPLRDSPNADGCLHCPTANCWCTAFAEAFEDATDAIDMRRVTEVAGNNALCAKSLNPNFVARLAHLLDIRRGDTFYDLGCGNGSILFQMALITGMPCVGVELSKHNAEVARRTWQELKPRLERLSGRPMPEVEIITGDLTDFILNPEFEDGHRVPKVLTSNLLLPLTVTHFMSERFRVLPVGSRIACFNDLYPHGRACSQSRDPEAFELFSMKDYVWPHYAVEWCSQEGPFYVHEKVA